MVKKILLDYKGLIPAIVQHEETKEVLMLGYMNQESLDKTLETGDVWFYSRSRDQLWHKGETSGNYLKLGSISSDCDGDALLVKALPAGPTCHTGMPSCFDRGNVDSFVEFEKMPLGVFVIEELFQVVQDRKINSPDGSYTGQLLKGDINRIAQKVVEEAGEAAIAGATLRKNELAEELADLFYHTLVLLAASDMSFDDVCEVLEDRRSRS
ncbi:MAG: bifunctional phosphoribosyl-AMP cyclohydrolase/phosphoribosyl-ATP diphosphatase HisIE [Dehalococcoidia bacterium]